MVGRLKRGQEAHTYCIPKRKYNVGGIECNRMPTPQIILTFDPRYTEKTTKLYICAGSTSVRVSVGLYATYISRWRFILPKVRSQPVLSVNGLLVHVQKNRSHMGTRSQDKVTRRSTQRSSCRLILHLRISYDLWLQKIFYRYARKSNNSLMKY